MLNLQMPSDADAMSGPVPHVRLRVQQTHEEGMEEGSEVTSFAFLMKGLEAAAPSSAALAPSSPMMDTQPNQRGDVRKTSWGVEATHAEMLKERTGATAGKRLTPSIATPPVPSPPASSTPSEAPVAGAPVPRPYVPVRLTIAKSMVIEPLLSSSPSARGTLPTVRAEAQQEPGKGAAGQPQTAHARIEKLSVHTKVKSTPLTTAALQTGEFPPPDANGPANSHDMTPSPVLPVAGQPLQANQETTMHIRERGSLLPVLSSGPRTVPASGAPASSHKVFAQTDGAAPAVSAMPSPPLHSAGVEITNAESKVLNGQEDENTGRSKTTALGSQPVHAASGTERDAVVRQSARAPIKPLLTQSESASGAYPFEGTLDEGPVASVPTQTTGIAASYGAGGVFPDGSSARSGALTVNNKAASSIDIATGRGKDTDIVSSLRKSVSEKSVNEKFLGAAARTVSEVHPVSRVPGTPAMEMGVPLQKSGRSIPAATSSMSATQTADAAERPDASGWNGSLATASGRLSSVAVAGEPAAGLHMASTQLPHGEAGSLTTGMHAAVETRSVPPQGARPLPAEPVQPPQPSGNDLPPSPSSGAMRPLNHEASSSLRQGRSSSSDLHTAAPGLSRPGLEASWTPIVGAGAPEAATAKTRSDGATAGNPFVHMDEMVRSTKPQLNAVTRVLETKLPDSDQGVVAVRAQLNLGQISASMQTNSGVSFTALTAQMPALHQYLADNHVAVHHLGIDLDGGGAGGSSEDERGAEQMYRDQPVPSVVLPSRSDALEEDQRESGSISIRA